MKICISLKWFIYVLGIVLVLFFLNNGLEIIISFTLIVFTLWLLRKFFKGRRVLKSFSLSKLLRARNNQSSTLRSHIRKLEKENQKLRESHKYDDRGMQSKLDKLIEKRFK